MKAISIRNPWAHDILCGNKEYEFRTWNTNYRGDLLICSSANPKIEGTLCGYALIVCELSDITQINSNNYKKFGLDDLDKPNEDEKLYAWHLTNLRMIKPFKIKGKLNFYTIDDSLIEYIDDEKMTEEECEEVYEIYFEPLVYQEEK